MSATGRAGFIFDRYDDSFKFVAIDAVNNELVIGHYTTKKGWVDDAVVSRTINAGQDYTLGVMLKGSTVSVTLDGQVLLGHIFNAVTVDGNFGLIATEGAASFDDVLLKTDDPYYRDPSDQLVAAQPASDDGAYGVVDPADLAPIVDEAIRRLAMSMPLSVEQRAALAGVDVSIDDLPGLTLAHTEADGESVVLDIDAAGHGWFVDRTPGDDREFRVDTAALGLFATPNSDAYGRMDLLSAVTHEFGHVLGLTHDSDLPFMAAALDDGLRLMPAYHDRAVSVPEQALTSQQQVKVQVFHETLNELLELEEANLLGHVARADLDGHPVDDFIVDVFDGKKHDHDDDHADDIAAGLDDAAPEAVSAGTGTAENATRNSGGGVHKQSGLIDWTAGSSLVDRLVNRIGE